MPHSSEKPDVFFAISDPTRRSMLLRLAQEGGKSVSELMAPFSMSQPAVSKHLRCLRRAGLVRRRSVGRMNFYTIEPHNLQEVHGWVAQFEKYWDQKLEALDRYLADRKKNKQGG